ncbi:MAG: rRNA maturation RNase YbeY [Terriglobia bacterium]
MRVAVDVAGARSFAARLARALRLGRREFNVCFVDDRAIRRLNASHRGKAQATDVLSFSWQGGNGARGPAGSEFAGFLGDIVISAQTARRNARREGHSTANEIRWLILHGVLHLLGHDHETDRGEMTALELSLRERLGIAGSRWRA